MRGALGDDTERQVEALGVVEGNGALARCWVCASVMGGVTPLAVSPPQIGGNSVKTEPSRSRWADMAGVTFRRPLAPGKNP
jgi:hypothetical protein